jgi:predicted P-loop ATPase
MITISKGRNRASTKWKDVDLEWDEFVALLCDTRVTKETMAQYDAMSKDEKGKIKDGPCFVGGSVQHGRRIKENVPTRSLITLDADECDEYFIDMVTMMLGAVDYVIYSTHSHRVHTPKYRLVINVDREMDADEYAAVSRKIAEEIGMEYFDKTTFDIHRLMYFPSRSKDAEEELVIEFGGPLVVDEVLARYGDDWRDAELWPKHEGEKTALNKMVDKLGDPSAKESIVGDFCSVYTMTEGIEIFLSDIYDSTGNDTRWTYLGGSSFGGMRVYDDAWAYSEHQTDPANTGHCLNIFDLVRVHKFGELDEDTSEKTNTSKRPSFKAMSDFALQDERVRMLLADRVLGDFDDEYEDGSDVQDGQASDTEDKPKKDRSWRKKLIMTKDGVVQNGKNIELILKNGAFEGVFAYDEFSNSEVIRADLPWRKRSNKRRSYEPWLGSDDKRLQHYLNTRYDFTSQAMIMNAFTDVVRQNTFHPIKEWLESVEWDGVERLDTLFIDYLGTPDGLYEREATRRMMIAAVKRLYEPGCKFDECMIIAGPQGSHKSSLLARLGGAWFSDSIKNLEGKEVGEHLQQAWIVELGELSAMKKSDAEEVKAFLSKTSDKYRVAYDRVVSEFPRRSVFFGTTNKEEFLQDMTGNRRFWPIKARPEHRKYSHFEDMTDEVLHQIWAEALFAYNTGEDTKVSREAHAIVEERQEAAKERDPREGLIEAYLAERESNLPDGAEPNLICAMEIWTSCLGESSTKMNRYQGREIVSILRTLKGWSERDTRHYFKEYGKQTAFDRVIDIS